MMTKEELEVEEDVILTMIEDVSKDDMEVLDEIDARADVFLGFAESWDNDEEGAFCRYEHAGKTVVDQPTPYTCSRTDLKRVRPKGYTVSMEEFCELETLHFAYMGFKFKFMPVNMNPDQYFESPLLPTEELAELWVIIKAVAWERKFK